jgi:hypothetical protein
MKYSHDQRNWDKVKMATHGVDFDEYHAVSPFREGVKKKVLGKAKSN